MSKDLTLNSSPSKWIVNLNLEFSHPLPSPLPLPSSFLFPPPSHSLYNPLTLKILPTWPAIHIMMIHNDNDVYFQPMVLFRAPSTSRSLANISFWRDHGDFKLNTIRLISALLSKLCWVWLAQQGTGNYSYSQTACYIPGRDEHRMIGARTESFSIMPRSDMTS